jgi:hypothetical protein
MWRRVVHVGTDVAPTCSGRFLVRGFFYPEVGGYIFLRKVSSQKNYTAPHPRRWNSSSYPNISTCRAIIGSGNVLLYGVAQLTLFKEEYMLLLYLDLGKMSY